MSKSPLDATVVVTVSYNSSMQLTGFLESVKLSEEDDLIVIVADNMSADLDSTSQIAQSHGARLLALPENRGYGGAINAAVASLPASFEYVLISNPDVELGLGTVTALLAELDGDPHVGAVGPRVLNADGSTYPSGRQLPSLRNGVGHALFARIWPDNPWSRSYRAESQGSDVRRPVGWLSGACLLVRRTAFEELNGFDEGFFMYFEDVDLGYRMGKAGWTNVYTPAASVVHTGAHSTSTESGKMVRAHHDSAYRYLEKKYSASYLAPVRWALKLGLTVRARVLARTGRLG
ncbi:MULTISPECIES: glycosyltransferase family 2 protein [Cryobacterium]|uniref:Glycosyltransferase family 2 protein n=1 Tax=Cryobacterium breve TaxID=1259258 RepID=A0ABY2JA66_9MICO|nr:MULTISPECIES: glycosyltransferase family 2 protein [Cryobacterium]TFC90428.1 glycosyltransferase family 2 protein [Cryobacterium sp. TmT3-12]TFD01845.1 glycosyltransferase family 2 protein [Cryobacterium breve]